jgi:hypothetical protein
MMSPRCAGCPRRRHRNREASETRFAQTADASLSDFGTGDVATSTGIHCNSNCNGNCSGNGTSNGNGRCAGNGHATHRNATHHLRTLNASPSKKCHAETQPQ